MSGAASSYPVSIKNGEEAEALGALETTHVINILPLVRPFNVCQMVNSNNGSSSCGQVNSPALHAYRHVCPPSSPSCPEKLQREFTLSHLHEASWYYLSS